jgi:resuscitation-promoting factor RpfC
VSNWRWLAALPSAGGAALCLMALTSNAPAIAAQDQFGFVAHTAVAAKAAGHTSERTEPYPKYRVYRLERRVERILAARREARADRRQAARAAARAAAAAARAAAQAQPSPNPQPAPVQPSGSVSTAGMAAFEACVISRESGGNPAAVNPSSGAGGLFQFLPSTWAGLGLGYPGGAQTAPVSVQEEGFAKLYAEAGTAPWASDGCA